MEEDDDWIRWLIIGALMLKVKLDLLLSKIKIKLLKKNKDSEKLEMRGIEPRASRMQSERSTI